MGLHDRDWYWEERRRKEKLHYNPKAFRWSKSESAAGLPFVRRPGRMLKVVLVCAVVVCLALFVSQWRRYDAATREQARESTRAQLSRLQAAERERIAAAEEQARASRLEQAEANRLRSISAMREDGVRATALAGKQEARRQKLWAKFYHPNPQCERNTTVECANAFIRARRRFNELYASGKF